MNIGWVEVVLVVGVAVLVFGPKRIPQLGSAFGKTLRGFKEELRGDAELPPADSSKAEMSKAEAASERQIIDR